MAKWDRNSKWQNGIEYFNRKNGIRETNGKMG